MGMEDSRIQVPLLPWESSNTGLSEEYSLEIPIDIVNNQNQETVTVYIAVEKRK